MKAVRIYEYGGADKLQFEDDVPDPQLKINSVLIKTAAAGVNPIDWKIRSGAMQKMSQLAFPAILGRDVSGVVQALGSNVDNFKVGDRVIAFTNATYAELVVVDGSEVTHLPDGVDLVTAAAIPLIALTGDQLVRQATTLKKDQTILITGAVGSVGRAAVHTAGKMGARVIAGVRTNQLSEARALNVADVLAIDDDEAVGRFAAVDAVGDTVGGDTAAKLLAKIKNGGNFGYTAMIPAGAAEKYPTVKVSRVTARSDPSKVREFADDMRDGKFKLPIGARYALMDADEAQRVAERGNIGKVLLLVG